MGLFDFLQPIASVAQSVIESRTAKRNTDETNRANRELAEYQYSKDLEMWNRGNEYNSPMSQMARLKAAGLNPNMVYGSGSAAGMAAGQLPKYQAPRQEFNYKSPVNLPAILGMYQDVQLRQAQIDNVRAQTLSTQAGIGLGPYAKSLDVQNREQLSREQVYKAEALRHGGMYHPNRNAVGTLYQSQHEFATKDLQRMALENEMRIANILGKSLENQWNQGGGRLLPLVSPALQTIVRGMGLRKPSQAAGAVKKLQSRKWTDKD